MTKEIVVEFIAYFQSFVSSFVMGPVLWTHTWTVFQHQPNQLLRHNDFVKSGDMRVQELTMMVDFTGEVRVFSWRRLEHDLFIISNSIPS